MIIFTRKFWDYALERALKTGAQVAIATIGTNVVGLLDIDFVGVFSTAGAAILLSVLTSVLNYKDQ